MGDGSKYKKYSKFLSLVLRHKPEAAGISLDAHGWAQVGDLLVGIQGTGRQMDMAVLEEIVATDEKQHYSFNQDKTKIRANQGHSLSVDLGFREQEPPEFLYHGTASRFVGSILAEGLKPMGRQYVHLSKDAETAVKVGERHGKPAVLLVRSGAMRQAGMPFYLSENGVWLTEHVPAEYLEITAVQE